MTRTSTKKAVLVIDVWDDHWDRETKEYLPSLADSINSFLKSVRGKWTIIHSPSECDIKFEYKIHEKYRAADSPPSAYFTRVTGKKVWGGIHPNIDVEDGDYVTNWAPQIFSILANHKVENVYLVGLHLDACIMDKPMGAQNLREFGFNPIVVEDLTETLFMDKEDVISKIKKDYKICKTSKIIQ